MNIPRDELLSAYLDGEVTDAQRAEVDALLAADPSARRLLDELRAVQAAVQRLPRLALGEDLTARVLQLAERRVLSETPASDDAPTPRDAPVRKILSRRAIVWSGLALAVALVIMVQERQRPVNRVNLPPGDAQVKVEPIGPIGPQSGPGTLGPIPGTIAKQTTANAPGGIQASAFGTSTGAPGQARMMVVKCLVRVDPAHPNALNALLAGQRIVRDDTPRLIAKAREQVGAKIEQTPPAGWVTAGEPSLIYSEANSDQIDGLLQAMRSQRDDFPDVVVEPGQKGAADQKQPLVLVIQPVRPK